jgi:hypothetical protein
MTTRLQTLKDAESSSGGGVLGRRKVPLEKYDLHG